MESRPLASVSRRSARGAARDGLSGGRRPAAASSVCVTLRPIVPCAFDTPVPGWMPTFRRRRGRPTAGRVDELVVRQPWVGVSSRFLARPRALSGRLLGARSQGLGAWRLGGDRRADGQMTYIRGRSDDSLKVAGERDGPAEIESARAPHSAVQGAAAIERAATRSRGRNRRLRRARPGIGEPSALAEAVRQTIGALLGATLRPARVHCGARSAQRATSKIMRRVIRATSIQGCPCGTSRRWRIQRRWSEITGCAHGVGVELADRRYTAASAMKPTPVVCSPACALSRTRSRPSDATSKRSATVAALWFVRRARHALRRPASPGAAFPQRPAR